MGFFSFLYLHKSFNVLRDSSCVVALVQVVGTMITREVCGLQLHMLKE